MSTPSGEKITVNEETKSIVVPDNPIIPFIEGDGIGVDIWAASELVFDAAVEKAYDGAKKLHGTKYLQVKRHMIRPVNGCRSRHLRI